MFKPLNATAAIASTRTDGVPISPSSSILRKPNPDGDSVREYFQVCEPSAGDAATNEVDASRKRSMPSITLLGAENGEKHTRMHGNSGSDLEKDESSALKKRKGPEQDMMAPRRSITAEDSGTGDLASPHRRKRAKTEDEKEQRRLERLLSNRLAAEKSRERKRKEFEALKAEKEEVERRNEDLEIRLARLQARTAKTPADKEYLQVVEQHQDTSSGKPVSKEMQLEREELSTGWKQLHTRIETFEKERAAFAEEMSLQKRNLEQEKSAIQQANIAAPNRNTTTDEKDRLIQAMALMTQEHRNREEEINKFHHDQTTTLLAARDQHAVTLVGLLNKKDQELVQKDHQLQELQRLADSKSDELKDAESRLASQETMIKTLETSTTSLQITLKEQVQVISALEEEIASSKAEKENLDEEISVNKTEIQCLQEEADTDPKAANIVDRNPVAKAGNVEGGSRSNEPRTNAIEVRADRRRSSDVPIKIAALSPTLSSKVQEQRPDQVRRDTNDSSATTSDDQRRNSSAQGDDEAGELADTLISVGTRRRSRAARYDVDSPTTSPADSKKSSKIRSREKRDREAEEEYVEIKNDDGTKPGHSYTQLIGMAIVESPDRQLRLAEIYKWISDTYSFYSVDAPLRKDWKNAIRSTLSTSKKFVRQWRPGEDPAKGSYWGIQDGEEDEFIGRPIYIKAKSNWQRIGRMKSSSS